MKILKIDMHRSFLGLLSFSSMQVEPIRQSDKRRQMLISLSRTLSKSSYRSRTSVCRFDGLTAKQSLRLGEHDGSGRVEYGVCFRPREE